MFIGNLDIKPFLCQQINKDSYILYKGKMVSSNLIDIEVIFNNHPSIRKKIMVDTHDNISLLNDRICEVCEIFPKLSGLNRLLAGNFKKKTETGLIELKKTGMIGDLIKSKDIIFFDLKFYEIWLDIEMILESSHAHSRTIIFEMKVIVNTSKKDFEDTLIKLGIKSWAKIIQNEDEAFYAFSEIEVCYTPIQSESRKFHHRINSQWSTSTMKDNNAKTTIDVDFDSKVVCKLKFTNITEIAFEIANMQYKRNNPKSFHGMMGNNSLRIAEVKRSMNKNLRTWLETNEDEYAKYKTIIWKYVYSENFMEDENIMDNDNGDGDDNQSYEESNTSFVSAVLINLPEEKKGLTAHKTQHNLIQFLHPLKTEKGRVSSFLNQSLETPGSPGHKRAVAYVTGEIDYDEIIGKNTGVYMSLKAFEKRATDTKNLVEVSTVNKESFDMIYSTSNNNKEIDTDTPKMKVYLQYCGIVLAGVIVILILYNVIW